MTSNKYFNAYLKNFIKRLTIKWENSGICKFESYEKGVKKSIVQLLKKYKNYETNLVGLFFDHEFEL